jgi:YidC/Oxa1 family membrane protein insertase
VAWARADALAGQHNRLEAFALQTGNNKHKHFGGPWKKMKNVPRGTKLMALAERYFCQIVRVDHERDDILLVPATGELLATEIHRKPSESMDRLSTTIYVGPRDFFHLKKSGFSDAFPIGIIGQIGLVLLLFLSWLASIAHNYGVAIILFSLAVTAMTAPFTLMSFRSMRKMQELKPRIDRLMEQHKSDPKRMNQEVFALYKEHRVSPLGGCLPMLLQMPIFIALFQGISHYIELRGASFLWIKDLSLPDRVAQLPFSVPLLGSEVNVLPAIMAIAMYLQTQASQKSMGSSAANNPTAQMMSGPLMPIVFFVMFYHFPAGLVLYWLTNSLSSMALYRLSSK